MFHTHRGFTVPELLIAIVIIGILSTLVIVNFSGVQPKARDSERKGDTETIAGYLETQFQKDGQYPTAATMTGSVSGVQAVLKGVSANILAAPAVAVGTNSVISYVVAAPPTISQYAYWTPSSATCTTPASYTVAACGTFVLAYKSEVDGSVIAICGRGANVNNAKAIVADATNGLSGFSAASCSNF